MKHTHYLAASAACIVAVCQAVAGPITPTFSTFGSLPAATFGGSGIPNDAVAITTSGGVTLGLTATPRYVPPLVGNNGAGTFYATPGVGLAPGLSKWNFSFYMENTTSSEIAIELLYDFDPGVGTDQSLLGSIKGTVAATSSQQNSWNLGFTFLDTAVPGLTPPTYASFDPSASGEYSFALILWSGTTELARSSINVNVPDAGSSLALLGMAFAGLGTFSLRRRS